MSEWFYSRDGKQKHGPFSETQLSELAKAGDLQPNDMVWKPGLGKWVQAVTAFPAESTWNSPVDREIWPEFVYKYLEHYFWQPQYLGCDGKCPSCGEKVKDCPSCGAKLKGSKTHEEFYETVRSLEVSLNFLTRLFFRMIPLKFRYACLENFQGIAPPEVLANLVVQNERDENLKDKLNLNYPTFIRTDLHLESNTTRIFIEIKIDHHVDLDQVHRHVLLHSFYDLKEGNKKQPFVFFLTKNSLADGSWKPRSESTLIREQGVQNFLQQRLGEENFGEVEKWMKKTEVGKLLPGYRDLCKTVVFSEITWQQLGDVIAREKAQQGETTESISNDFLTEIRRRDLWQPGNG